MMMTWPTRLATATAAAAEDWMRSWGSWRLQTMRSGLIETSADARVSSPAVTQRESAPGVHRAYNARAHGSYIRRIPLLESLLVRRKYRQCRYENGPFTDCHGTVHFLRIEVRYSKKQVPMYYRPGKGVRNSVTT